MTTPNCDRRAALTSLSSLLLSAYAADTPAQATGQGPIPQPWQMLGMVQSPLPHGLLSLGFDEIVLPGDVPVVGRSGLRFTQTLMLFTSARQAPGVFEQIAMKTLGPGDQVELRFMLKATRTLTLTLLAKTPAGWFRTDKELKVGKAGK